MNFKFNQHLTLHVITSVQLEKADPTYPISIVSGVFVLAISISIQKPIFLLNMGEYREYAKICVIMLKTRLFLADLPPRPIALALFAPE